MFHSDISSQIIQSDQFKKCIIHIVYSDICRNLRSGSLG